MLALGRFPTIEYLERRGFQFQQMRKKCPWCSKELERVDHLCFKCKFVEGFWRRIFNWWEMRWEPVEGGVQSKNDTNGYDDFPLEDESNDVGKGGGLEMSWRFPPRGWLKFNVCGVVFEAKAGGEGVLRDEDGVARALFSGPSEAKDAKLAELNSTGVALELYEGMGWATCCPLLIEVGSNVVFKWLS
ncbi:hypothetical protein Goklo_012001 [Gossypium klotzschianum]|uniref:Reverse transcriptase zinc-binding domain-containing protein n=3 Tax=Gossypium TaxID=3633 RepID=A0A7J8VB62_9ROSI|nr:hypothetical protein [Gossypium klotzschianum]